MPSPLGHALGGIIAGRPLAPRSRHVLWVLAAVGAAADLDLLAGAHRGPSHSLGAAILAAAVAWAATRRWRWGAAAGLAWASHVLLDWLGQDTSPPRGIEALWPFSTRYAQAPFVVFPSVIREYWRPEFWSITARAAAVEVAILLPLAVAVVLLARRRPSG